MRHFASRHKKALLILLPLVIALFIAAFYNGLTTTVHTLHSDKITQPVKIVLITDLHSCIYGKSQDTLVGKINAQQPDLILMAGDILDDHMPDDGTIALLEGISNTYRCFYVTGNHEFWSGRVDAQKALLRSYGVTVLEGDCVEVMVSGQSLQLCGVDDPEVGASVFAEQLDATAAAIDGARFSILLSHRPELFEIYSEHDFDLVLSGHAHGGQLRIPLLLPDGLISPNQGWFPAYTNGIHERNDTKMLVSRGMSRESTRLPRIFNAPELVVINLVPE